MPPAIGPRALKTLLAYPELAVRCHGSTVLPTSGYLRYLQQPWNWRHQSRRLHSFAPLTKTELHAKQSRPSRKRQRTSKVADNLSYAYPRQVLEIRSEGCGGQG